jgi:glycosyltransferase involved in cell wall biosynthesis
LECVEAGEYSWWQSRWQAGFGRRLARLAETVRPDIVHLHDIWSNGARESMAIAARRGLPYVISPEGNLQRSTLRQRRFRKRAAMWLYARRGWLGAVAYHATSQEEAADLRGLKLPQPVVIIPNGVAPYEGLGRRIGASGPLGELLRGLQHRRLAVSVSRISPEKGILMLLEAWQAVRPAGWTLVLAGNDFGGHLRQVQRRIAALALGDLVQYAGAVSDEEKHGLYEQAELCVQCSYSENFGMAIAEALAHARPVITTTGTPWAFLERERCGWWVPAERESIAQALRHATGLSGPALRGAGERGRVLIERDHAWLPLAKQTLAFYAWALTGCLASAKPRELSVLERA